MKVIAINGSPRLKGNTFQAIETVFAELNKENIETEVINVGTKVLRGCMSCGGCFKNKDEKCVFDDGINEIIQKMKEADGIILGTPVHYASVGGAMKSFLDRAFYVAGANGGLFRHKVGASVVAVRRSGGIPTFNELNNFFNYSEMLLATSNYWNVIHGRMPGEIEKDEEGLQIMRVLGKNMAWLLKLVENGKDIVAPEKEQKIMTSFVR